MNSQPDIIISELDYSRIDNLLRATPGIATNIKSALLTELERAELVAPEQIPANVVTMNSQVKSHCESKSACKIAPRSLFV